MKNKAVQCQLCPHFCFLKSCEKGKCGVRMNKEGTLYSLVYRKLCSMAVDAIEKKPLFHFAPGTKCLSIATVGCNLSCSFCQNWEISHPLGGEICGEETTPERIIEIAKKQDLPGIAYTYTEPTIAIEFYLEVMRLARKEGLYNVWVSNGYTNPEPAKRISGFLDAINVDLKGDIKFYQKLCDVPSEKPMKKVLEIYKSKNVWIEITNLVIPEYNDSIKQITKLVQWVKKKLGPETPIHFSRFFPYHKLQNVRFTPAETLEMAAKIADKNGMHYIYVGNVPNPRESTYCPNCKAVIIKRNGYGIGEIKERCPRCGYRIKLAGLKWVK